MYTTYAIVSTVYNAVQLRRIHKIKVDNGYKFESNDIAYDDNYTVVKVILVCHISGMMGGVVGIAGGIILGPVLLQLGMLPVLVSNTGQYLSLISTISVTSQFVYLEMLNFEYALILGCLSSVCAYIGITYINHFIAKTGR